MEKPKHIPELEQEVRQAIQSRLPDRIFDAHCHLPAARRDIVANFEGDPGIAYWQQALGKLFGTRRLRGAMVMPDIVAPEKIRSANAYVRGEAAKYTGFCLAYLVAPADDPDEVEDALRQNRLITTLKPYFRYSPDSWSSTFDQFFPAWMAGLADKHHLSVTLHLGRERAALSDPLNFRLIRDYCEKYPNMRLILAHNALGHNVENLRRGLPEICGYPNIWFDSSGISEASSTAAILEYFGPKRLLYGSDMPLGEILGKIYSTGNGFYCNFEGRSDFNQHFETSEYITTAYEFSTECVISLLTAADQWGLTKDDLADIFYHNAAWVYRLREDGSGPAPDWRAYEENRYLAALAGQKQPVAVSSVFSSIADRGNTVFIDLASPAARDCPLGFREHASMTAARRGVSSGLPTGGDAAIYSEKLCAEHPWADRAFLTASPDEALQLAVKAARSATGRAGIVLCLPQNAPLTFPFAGSVCPYGDRETLKHELAAPAAAVILPPAGFFPPDDDYLRLVVALARQTGAVLIFDERESGFRVGRAGCHLLADFVPDIAVYGASAANGYALGAVVATASVSDALALIPRGCPEAHAIGAALAVWDAPAEHYRQLAAAGRLILASWEKAAAAVNLPVQIHANAVLPWFEFKCENSEDNENLRQAYIGHMARRGFIADTFAYPKATDIYVKNMEQAVCQAFAAGYMEG